MSYADNAKAIDQLGESEVISLTDRDNLGVVDTTVLQGALSDATGEIDIYLAGRYATPLSIVPPLIATYCVDIARYRLSGGQVAETDQIRTRYKDAIRFLEGVRDGKNKLGADVTSAPADASQSLVTLITPSGRIFSRGAR